MILFLIIAFLLPLVSITMQSIIENTVIDFILYGMEAASPSIAAIIVLYLNKSIRSYFVENFSYITLRLAVFLPIFITFIPMFIAKLFTSLFYEDINIFGNVTFIQFIIISWAFIAEELGWRGYLQPLLEKNMKQKWVIPFLVGLFDFYGIIIFF